MPAFPELDIDPLAIQKAISARRLGVIGTAGRQGDGDKLNAAMFDKMLAAARAVLRHYDCQYVVSGGAAWADHVAVRLALTGAIPPQHLLLRFPAEFLDGGFDEQSRDGATANHYHRLFSMAAQIDSIAEIRQVIALGAIASINRGGFKARNADVAADSDVLLAFTFGKAPFWMAKATAQGSTAAGLKPGGTAHTWDMCRSRHKIHISLQPIDGAPG